MEITMVKAIRRLARRKNLGPDLAKAVMLEIMDGKCTQAQIGGFLMGLRLCD